MSWNRIYRPKSISDLHLQSVRDYFTSLLDSQTFPQVFLFTGPKGTGKTSTARIIGALLNDPKNAKTVERLFIDKTSVNKKLSEPQKNLQELEEIFSGRSYLVQELDAASNRGIDDVRSLKERVQLPPVQGLISVYILDEVHMLTSEAFNALLKLLEEPPNHVVFILATTELQKVPETVVSRCQVVQFSLASEPELLDSMKKVAKNEKLTFEDEALSFIATQANGSFRDAIKLLEQAAQMKSFDKASLEKNLGRSYQPLITNIIENVLSKNAADTIDSFQILRSQGAHESSFHKDLVTYLHQQLLIGSELHQGTAEVPYDAARFLLQELAASELSQPSPLPFLRLELKLLDIIERALKKGGSTQANTPPRKTKPQPAQASVIRSVPKVKTETFEENSPSPELTTAPKIITDTEVLSGDGETLYKEWPQFVSQVAQTNFSLATLLKSAKPVSGEAGAITLSVFYKFHQEQLLQPKFTQQLNSLIQDTYGGSVKINCVLSDQPAEAELAEPVANIQLEKLAADALM